MSEGTTEPRSSAVAICRSTKRHQSGPIAGYWDNSAEEYLAEHGTFLGASDFMWCPEGIHESDVNLLGAVDRQQILEVGCGAGQCSRWLAEEGAIATGVDVSAGMLEQASRLQREHPLSDEATPPTFLLPTLVSCPSRRTASTSRSPRMAHSPSSRTPKWFRRGGTRRPPGRALGVLYHSPDAVDVSRCSRRSRSDVEYSYFDRTPYVESPLRTAGLRRAPSDHERLGQPARDRRFHDRFSDRAGVARVQPDRLGRMVAPARDAHAGHRHLQHDAEQGLTRTGGCCTRPAGLCPHAGRHSGSFNTESAFQCEARAKS